MERLARGPATVNELAKPFAITQQAVSKHLAYLERALLIEKRREGRQHICSLTPDAIREVAEWAENYRRFWEANFERLDGYLQQMKKKERNHDTGK